MDQAVRGRGTAPPELVEFEYRKIFGLSHQEMLEEPMDVFLQNCQIMDAVAKRDKRGADKLKHG